MPRLPFYEQQTSINPRQATAEQFGSGAGAALQEAGNVLGQIGANVRQREETIDRVRLLTDFDRQAIVDLEALQTTGDIAATQTVEQYHQGLRQRMDQVLSQHSGSSASRAELRAQLENQVGQYHKSATATQIRAQHALIGDRIDQITNQLSTTAAMAPDQIVNAFVQLDAEITNIAPGMTADEEMKYRTAGRSRIARNAIDGFLQRGDFERAKVLMSDPAVTAVLDPDSSRQLSMNIAVGSYKAEQEVIAKSKNVAKWTTMLGRNLTPEELIRVESLPMKKSEMTPADEIVQLELIQNRPASQQQIDKIFGTYIAPTGGGGGGAASKGGIFGNSMQGRAWDYLTSNANRFANGLMTPQEAMEYQSAYAVARQPIRDPDTGRLIPPPSTPPYIEQAMEQGSAIFGLPTAQVPPGVSDQPTQDAGPRVSMWKMAGDVAGPIAGVQRLVGGGPVDFGLGIGDKQVAAAQQVEMQQRNLVRALQQNPRYAEGERKSIAEDIKIEPQVLSNPGAYRTRLVEIGRYIDEEIKYNSNVLTSASTTQQQRQQAMQSVSTLTQFFGTLDLPPRVNSVNDAKKLPSGTMFLDNNWILRKVP